ncbi:MAG: polysaccharide biosynthesis protein [Candidatus Obscuribacter sp.]|nr:polysaccharide biosynthesis protein [Candidatus Obscuribacter sp.]
MDNSQNEEVMTLAPVGKLRWKRMMQVVSDALLASLSLSFAYVIRFDGHIQQQYLHQLWQVVPPLVALRLISNWRCGLYGRLWRYTGLTEVAEIGVAVLNISALMLILRALSLPFLRIEGQQLSYSIIVIDMMLCFFLMTACRVLRRLQTEHAQRKHWRQPVRRRALVVGAGDAGMMVLKELNQRSDLGVDVVGLIDDDPTKTKKRIGNITVFGTTADLPRLVDTLFVEQVIIAMPSAPASEIRRIVDMCRVAEVETRILPGLFELINGRVSINQLRDVSLEDLLGRDQVKLDDASISSYIEGRTVLVTGAGGSIGSELCRQILRYEPRKIVLLGKGENSIFGIQQELVRRLAQRHAPVEIVAVIADIRDEKRIEYIFETQKPDLVFHAAAHKHVPLMEANINEAVTNNIFGTRVVAEMARKYKVQKFVLVSSDKAVNPTSVMGASKRVAEIIIQNLAASTSATKYVAVRFGNVLASRGSVIPLWRQQIASGGPVTVTHPDVTRYFMLIPEAVQLILQAGAFGSGGEVFVLDMGKPVKILDLANDLIKFSGLTPGVDIKIEFTGLRPGEKLFEELLTEAEGLSRTASEKIFVGKASPPDGPEVAAALQRFKGYVEALDETGIRKELNSLCMGTLTLTDTTNTQVVSSTELPNVAVVAAKKQTV